MAILLTMQSSTSLTHCPSSGAIASGFGVSAGIFALFFFGEVPRVRKDILQKVPIIGPYFVREVPPEDNVRQTP